MSDAAATIWRLNAEAKRDARLIAGIPLLCLGLGLLAIHLRSSELLTATCRVTTSEELGFLSVRLETELAGRRYLSSVIASCRSPADRARSCGHDLSARVPCHYYKVDPGDLHRERPEPDLPLVPGFFLLGGGLYLVAALLAWLRAGPSSLPRLAWASIQVRGRSVLAMVLGSPLLAAGLGLTGLALHLLWSSSSLHTGFGVFALLSGLCAALLGAVIGFSRCELRFDRAAGVLQRRRGIFAPFLRRSFALGSFQRVWVEEVKGRTARHGSYRLHYLVFDPARPEDPTLRVAFPNAASAASAADVLRPLVGAAQR